MPLTLEIEETAVLPLGLRRGGKDEEVKLEEIYLARCQKSREELEKAVISLDWVASGICQKTDFKSRLVETELPFPMDCKSSDRTGSG